MKLLTRCLVLLSILALPSAGSAAFTMVFDNTQLTNDSYWVYDPTPTIGNLTGSSALEIVYGTGDPKYMCLDSRGTWLWDGMTPDDSAGASPAFFDLDRDGRMEVVGGSNSGQWVLSYTGATGAVEWAFGGPHTNPDGSGHNWGEFKGSPAIVEVRSDYPGREVIMADQAGHVFCLSAAGQLIWAIETSDPSAGVWNRFTAATPVLDVNNDRALEVIAVSDAGQVYCLRASDGAVRWVTSLPELIPTWPAGFDISGEIYSDAAVIASPAVANLDSDRALEIVVGSYGGNLYCLDGATGATQWVYAAGGPIASSPAIGDIDYDGTLEIVFGSEDGNVYSLDRTGRLEWAYATDGKVNGPAALFNRANNTRYAAEWPMFRHDLSQSGYYGSTRSSLSVSIGSDDGYLYLLSGRGALLDRYQAPGPINSGTAVGDIDGDKKLEILFKTGVHLMGVRDNR